MKTSKINTLNIVKFSPHSKIIFVFNKNINIINTSNNNKINFLYIINKLDYYYNNCNKFEQ